MHVHLEDNQNEITYNGKARVPISHLLSQKDARTRMRLGLIELGVKVSNGNP